MKRMLNMMFHHKMLYQIYVRKRNPNVGRRCGFLMGIKYGETGVSVLMREREKKETPIVNS